MRCKSSPEVRMSASLAAAGMPPPPASVPPHPAAVAPARWSHIDRDALLASGLKWLLLLALIVFLGLPLVSVLVLAVLDQHGVWSGLLPWQQLLSNPNFMPMVGRSIAVSAAVATLVVPLAYLFAYALHRTLIPLKGVWRAVALLPLLAPSLLPGIALIYLFGNQGLFKEWMNGSIYGFWGILLGQAFYTFPHALMILLSALSMAETI